MKVLGIIPARYASTRFPAKALADIDGKTVIERVYNQARRAKQLEKIVVATDHKKIYDHARSFGAMVCMTSAHHVSGTDRCYEALTHTEGRFDYVVNIQGDEPFIAPEQIDSLVALLDGKVQLATLIKKIKTHTEIGDDNVVKVILNRDDEAIYFSRGALPYLRDVPEKEWLSYFTYFKHIGLYAYRSDVLGHISKLPPSPLERIESLEQLRWIENGYTIKVGKTEHESFAIDTPKDLANVLSRLRGKGV